MLTEFSSPPIQPQWSSPTRQAEGSTISRGRMTENRTQDSDIVHGRVNDGGFRTPSRNDTSNEWNSNERVIQIRNMSYNPGAPELKSVTPADFFIWEQEYLKYWNAGGLQPPLSRLNKSQRGMLAYQWHRHGMTEEYGQLEHTEDLPTGAWFDRVRKLFVIMSKGSGLEGKTWHVKFEFDSLNRPNFELHAEKVLAVLQDAPLEEKEKVRRMYQAYADWRPSVGAQLWADYKAKIADHSHSFLQAYDVLWDTINKIVAAKQVLVDIDDSTPVWRKEGKTQSSKTTPI